MPSIVGTRDAGGSATPATSGTVSHSSLTNGDLVLIPVVLYRATAAQTWSVDNSSGFEIVYEDTYQALFAKRITDAAGEPDPFTLGWTTTESWFAQSVVVRPDASEVLAAVASEYGPGANTSFSQAVMAAIDGQTPQLRVAFGAVWEFASSTDWATPSGWTEHLDTTQGDVSHMVHSVDGDYGAATFNLTISAFGGWGQVVVGEAVAPGQRWGFLPI